MRRSIELILVLTVATVIAATGSHLLVHWAKIRTTLSEPLVFGTATGRPPAFRAGSSLADYQLDWNQVAEQTGAEIKAWGVAAGSPYEFEQFQKMVPDAQTTYLVISAFDMDEANVSDFRASLVPLKEAIETLRVIHADWAYSKRALSQYPMTWFRTLFPTLGRSRGIMGRLREEMVRLVKSSDGKSESIAEPTLDGKAPETVDNYKLQRMSDWPQSRILGKLDAQRVSFEGGHWFNGPKHLALSRMLHYGCERGRTIVIVVPVSAAYTKEFMTPELTRKFETSLADARRSAPASEWVRLDQVPGLDSDQYFCDLVHMNVYGQKIVTEDFLAWLKQPSHQP